MKRTILLNERIIVSTLTKPVITVQDFSKLHAAIRRGVENNYTGGNDNE